MSSHNLPFLNMKKKVILNYPKSAAMGFVPRDPRGGRVVRYFSFLISFSLSLGDGPIYTEILYQRAVKPKPTNQPSKGPKNEFEIAVVKESSVFEPSKFYCSWFIISRLNTKERLYKPLLIQDIEIKSPDFR